VVRSNRNNKALVAVEAKSGEGEREMLVGGDEGDDKRDIDTSMFCALTTTAMIPFSCVNSTFLFHFSF
jgi:hypothetical protein